MKLSRFFELAVAAGSAADPRGRQAGISGYADSAILFGDPDTLVKSVLVGIDIDETGLLLAERLRHRRRIDLVLSHHPSGPALAGLYRVMELQVRLLERCGVSKESARKFLDQRTSEVRRKIDPLNHMRAVDCARLLNIPFACVHTPADNCAGRFIETLLARHRPRDCKEILDVLGQVEEYRRASAETAGPRLVQGSPHRPAGKIFVEMTGGASGPAGACADLGKAGVRTLVSMHISEDYLKKANSAGINAVVAGHISSDTLGMNLLLDRIEQEEPLDIVCCSGFRRFRRTV